MGDSVLHQCIDIAAVGNRRVPNVDAHLPGFREGSFSEPVYRRERVILVGFPLIRDPTIANGAYRFGMTSSSNTRRFFSSSDLAPA